MLVFIRMKNHIKPIREIKKQTTPKPTVWFLKTLNAQKTTKVHDARIIFIFKENPCTTTNQAKNTHAVGVNVSMNGCLSMC